MIPNFFQTVQKDFNTVVDFIKHIDRPHTTDQNKLVALAALRIFASIGMGVNLIGTFTAIPLFAVAPGAALVKAALSTLAYVLFHDVFVLARNKSEEIENRFYQVGNNVAGFVRDVGHLLRGHRELVGQGVATQQTEGTILQPVWVKIFA